MRTALSLRLPGAHAVSPRENFVVRRCVDYSGSWFLVLGSWISSRSPCSSQVLLLELAPPPRRSRSPSAGTQSPPPSAPPPPRCSGLARVAFVEVRQRDSARAGLGPRCHRALVCAPVRLLRTRALPHLLTSWPRCLISSAQASSASLARSRSCSRSRSRDVSSSRRALRRHHHLLRKEGSLADASFI